LHNLVLGFSKTNISTQQVSAAARVDLTSQQATKVKKRVFINFKAAGDQSYRLLPSVLNELALRNSGQLFMELGLKFGEPAGHILQDDEVTHRFSVSFGGKGLGPDCRDYSWLGFHEFVHKNSFTFSSALKAV
jgi:hypothetical protein